MGDWSSRTYWVAASDEAAALEVYERLEGIAEVIRRDGAWRPEPDAPPGTSLLRFGFGSPRLVVAVASQKWGDDPELGEALVRGLDGVTLLVGTDEGLDGDVQALAPAFPFAWSGDEATDRALDAAGFERVRFGEATVCALDRATGARMFEGGLRVPPKLRAACGEGASIVLGVASPVHGLVALATVDEAFGSTSAEAGADAMPLWAQRIEGGNNSAVVRDGVRLLPRWGLAAADVSRLERHGPQMLWQPLAARAEAVRAALADGSPAEVRAAHAMMRRWRLGTDGSPAPLEAQSEDAGWATGLPDAPAVGRYVDARRGRDTWLDGARSVTAARRLAALVSSRADDRLRALARRFAELAYAASRSSYWMVRDGAPGPDVPVPWSARPLAALWDGSPEHVADQMVFWSTAAVRAASAEGTPACAAAAAFVAFEAAVAAGRASGAWSLPPSDRIEALVDAEVGPCGGPLRARTVP
jgi:hypothetical protein